VVGEKGAGCQSVESMKVTDAKRRRSVMGGGGDERRRSNQQRKEAENQSPRGGGPALDASYGEEANLKILTRRAGEGFETPSNISRPAW